MRSGSRAAATDSSTSRAGGGAPRWPAAPDAGGLLDRRRAVTGERAFGRLIPFVFSRAHGQPIRGFRKAWGTACRKAGVPGRVLHDFRRTAVRNLLRAGVPERVANAAGRLAVTPDARPLPHREPRRPARGSREARRDDLSSRRNAPARCTTPAERVATALYDRHR